MIKEKLRSTTKPITSREKSTSRLDGTWKSHRQKTWLALKSLLTSFHIHTSNNRPVYVILNALSITIYAVCHSARHFCRKLMSVAQDVWRTKTYLRSHAKCISLCTIYTRFCSTNKPIEMPVVNKQTKSIRKFTTGNRVAV